MVNLFIEKLYKKEGQTMEKSMFERWIEATTKTGDIML